MKKLQNKMAQYGVDADIVDVMQKYDKLMNSEDYRKTADLQAENLAMKQEMKILRAQMKIEDEFHEKQQNKLSVKSGSDGEQASKGLLDEV